MTAPTRRGWRALLAGVLAGGLASPAATLAEAADAPGARAVVHAQGRPVAQIAAERLRASGLLEHCEAQLRGAPTVLRLAVSDTQIDAVRREALALEIIYPQARPFTLASGRQVVASRLLLPLAGELAGSVTTIFVGNPNYQAGPLRNPQGTAEIAALVQSFVPAAR